MGPELPHFFYSALFFQRDKYLWEWWQPLKERRNSEGQDLEQTFCLPPLVGSWDRPPKHQSWALLESAGWWQLSAVGSAGTCLHHSSQDFSAGLPEGGRLRSMSLRTETWVTFFCPCLSALPLNPLPFKKQTDGGSPFYFHLSLHKICWDFVLGDPQTRIINI